MSNNFCFHMICLGCLLYVPCKAAVEDNSCNTINVDNCTKYGNANCNANKCRCMHNFYDNGFTCTTKKSRGEKCTGGNSCRSPLACKDGTCQCATISYLSGLTSRPKRSVVVMCNDANECPSPMNCSHDICLCGQSQYWTGSDCAKGSSVNEACERHVQCFSYMMCTNGRCQCEINQYWKGSYCSEKKRAGVNCNGDNECLSPMNCTAGSCTCGAEKYWKLFTCAAQKSLDVNCEADTECLSSLLCTDGTCQCATHHRWIGSSCVALTRVPKNVIIRTTSRSIQISWSEPEESKSSIIGYRVRVLSNNDCVVELLFVCSCTNVVIQHICTSAKRQIRENKSNTELVSSILSTIDQLLPYTYYDVWINAINAAGDGNMSQTLVQTDSEVPQKPLGVAASVLSSSEITITWKMPLPRPGNTTYYIEAYEVVLNAQPTFLKKTNVTGFHTKTAHLFGLEAYWNYTFSVIAATDKGNSEQSEMSTFVTTKQDAPGNVTNFNIKRPTVILTTMEVSWSMPLLRERNGIIKEYRISHNISGITQKEVIVADSDVFQKLYYITPGRHYQVEIYAVNSLNQEGEKQLKIYYASSKLESQSGVSLKGYTIETVVGAAVGCVVFSGIVVYLVFCIIRKHRRNINSKQTGAHHIQEEPKIGGQYEEIGMDNVSANLELGTKDMQNIYDHIDRRPTVDKQYENMMCK